MAYDPYKQTITISLILMAALLAFVLLWMLIRKYAYKTLRERQWADSEEEILAFTPLGSLSPSRGMWSPPSAVEQLERQTDRSFINFPPSQSIAKVPPPASAVVERAVKTETMLSALSSGADTLQVATHERYQQTRHFLMYSYKTETSGVMQNDALLLKESLLHCLLCIGRSMTIATMRPTPH